MFSSAERFLFRYAEDKDWDILLLDIEMGTMDGVTLVKKVRRMCFGRPGFKGRHHFIPCRFSLRK